MSKYGTGKARSIEHEQYIASRFGGVRSPSSGASVRDAGDVETDIYSIECKCTGGPSGWPAKPTFIRQLEKLAEEAYSAGREPMLALRYYLPNSPLANFDGWVDVIVRPLGDVT